MNSIESALGIAWIPNADNNLSRTISSTNTDPVSPSQHINIPVLSHNKEANEEKFVHFILAGK